MARIYWSCDFQEGAQIAAETAVLDARRVSPRAIAAEVHINGRFQQRLGVMLFKRPHGEWIARPKSCPGADLTRRAQAALVASVKRHSPSLFEG